MSAKPIEISGGQSVYCINERQMRDAQRLATQDPESAPLIEETIEYLEETLNRNERAALAFVLIERLRRSNE